MSDREKPYTPLDEGSLFYFNLNRFSTAASSQLLIQLMQKKFY